MYISVFEQVHLDVMIKITCVKSKRLTRLQAKTNLKTTNSKINSCFVKGNLIPLEAEESQHYSQTGVKDLVTDDKRSVLQVKTETDHCQIQELNCNSPMQTASSGGQLSTTEPDDIPKQFALKLKTESDVHVVVGNEERTSPLKEENEEEDGNGGKDGMLEQFDFVKQETTEVECDVKKNDEACKTT